MTKMEIERLGLRLSPYSQCNDFSIFLEFCHHFYPSALCRSFGINPSLACNMIPVPEGLYTRYHLLADGVLSLI